MNVLYEYIIRSSEAFNTIDKAGNTNLFPVELKKRSNPLRVLSRTQPFFELISILSTFNI